MGPVWPDNVHETGVLPIGQSGFPVVATDAEQVVRTRRKTWSRARSEVFVPVGCIYSVHPSEQGIRTWLRTWTPPVPAKQSGTLGTAPMEAGLRS